MCSVIVEGRLATRAARFGPEADVLVREVGEKSHGAGILRNSKKWGAIEGRRSSQDFPKTLMTGLSLSL